ncbi:hypothetical protein O3Q51_06240 [Cryomorphaceae bacterium 1068]|nr:hypothetical protein [Cryomorphaceae bacterium 1068]
MPKQTAFGGDNNFQDFKSEGVRIVNEADTEKLMEWLDKLRSDESIEVQQAAAVCHAISDVSPTLFEQFQKELIEVIRKNVHTAGPRFTYRVLAEILIDEENLGEVIDLSFESLKDSHSPIAIQVFSMTVIANQMKRYPELGVELEAAIQFRFNTGSAGFKNRALKIAKAYGLKIEENM